MREALFYTFLAAGGAFLGAYIATRFTQPKQQLRQAVVPPQSASRPSLPPDARPSRITTTADGGIAATNDLRPPTPAELDAMMGE